MKNYSFVNRVYGFILRIMFSGWHQLRISERRNRLRFFDRLTPIHPRVSISELREYAVPTKKITAAGSPVGTILYLHGGAYVLGMTNNHVNMCGRLAEKTRMQVLAPRYRLAPENPFPAALYDVFSIYSVISEGLGDRYPLFIGGDSAGGGLAFALLQEIREQGCRMPNGAFMFSPWTDLTLSGDSVQVNAEKDPMLTEEGLQEDARAYAGTNDLEIAQISPIFGNAYHFPPLLLQVGSREILLDDTRNFAHKAQEQGCEVILSEWEGLYHVFQILPMLPAADKALDQISEFIDQNS